MANATTTALAIAVPTLLFALIVFCIGLYYPEKISKWFKRTADFNAPPLGRYEPMKRWSEGTLTSVSPSKRVRFTSSSIPTPTVEIVLTPPPPSAGRDAAGCRSWQVRQQQREVLNDTARSDAANSSLRACRSRERSHAAPPMRGRGEGMPGHVQVQARKSGRSSRAKSITETELRDLQYALSAFQEPQQEEKEEEETRWKALRMCRSVEVMTGQQAYTIV